mmetsp:Transcript_289/g.523  ORF Transcript_289/g.523 Transcript_289/m.523 type:complete len:240 (-) Transcript_289:95-814(-)
MSSFADNDDDSAFKDAVEGPDSTGDGMSPDSPSNATDEATDGVKSEPSLIELEKMQDDGHARDIGLAMEAKEKGNTCFREKDYDGAIDNYSQAIYLCPWGDEHKEQMSIFYGNRAACYSAMQEHDHVVTDCSIALELNDTYVKVLMRRAQAYEVQEKYEEAIKDIKRAQEIDPTYPRLRETLARVEKLNAEKFEKMKDEALGKLKDLGNSILGNFGMSLDNFKMEQDKNTGSWSISMNK